GKENCQEQFIIAGQRNLFVPVVAGKSLRIVVLTKNLFLIPIINLSLKRQFLLNFRGVPASYYSLTLYEMLWEV
ncbi:MAG: hypothetical protein U9O90_01700, partial [Euryarchaeota archaeon]|nr:hypothetical protein [Euryarchaeota archaeon]